MKLEMSYEKSHNEYAKGWAHLPESIKLIHQIHYCCILYRLAYWSLNKADQTP